MCYTKNILGETGKVIVTLAHVYGYIIPKNSRQILSIDDYIRSAGRVLPLTPDPETEIYDINNIEELIRLFNAPPVTPVTPVFHAQPTTNYFTSIIFPEYPHAWAGVGTEGNHEWCMDFFAFLCTKDHACEIENVKYFSPEAAVTLFKNGKLVQSFFSF